MDDNLIPIIGMVLIFGLPMFGWILGRVYKHRERMEMLRRGMMPPPNDRGWRAMRGQARWGAAQWGPPGPQPMGAPVPPYVPVDDPDSAQCTLHGGIKVAMVGFALLIGLSFIGYHSNDGPFGVATIHPGPWLLGGLIPMFVGIAQIIIALLSGATFTMRMSAPRMGPPGGPPPPGQRSYGSPQPGQPGPRYEELARPVQPPERK
jgi:hypothetical protein